MPRIVMIDDDPSTLGMIEIFLKSLGWESSGSGDGVSGLGLIASAKPDVILLDVNLPDMSGFDICSKLKDGAQTRAIPLMLISGDHKKAEDILKGLSNSRADAYMVKPVNLMVLKAKLEAMLKPLESK